MYLKEFDPVIFDIRYKQVDKIIEILNRGSIVTVFLELWTDSYPVTSRKFVELVKLYNDKKAFHMFKECVDKDVYSSLFTHSHDKDLVKKQFDLLPLINLLFYYALYESAVELKKMYVEKHGGPFISDNIYVNAFTGDMKYKPSGQCIDFANYNIVYDYGNFILLKDKVMIKRSVTYVGFAKSLKESIQRNKWKLVSF